MLLFRRASIILAFVNLIGLIAGLTLLISGADSPSRDRAAEHQRADAPADGWSVEDEQRDSDRETRMIQTECRAEGADGARMIRTAWQAQQQHHRRTGSYTRSVVQLEAETAAFSPQGRAVGLHIDVLEGGGLLLETTEDECASGHWRLLRRVDGTISRTCWEQATYTPACRNGRWR